MKAVHRVLDPNIPAQTRRGVCALGVMTKAPRPGQVKTRLVPPFTPQEAAGLNVCFLRDTANAITAAIEKIAGICNRRPVGDVARARRTSQGRALHSEAAKGKAARGVGVYTPRGAEAAYENILPEDFFLIPQRGGSFGERLYFAAADLLKCGFNSVCLIDSDSPTVGPESFVQAVEFLDSPGDCVALGPSDDGGYYLIGLKEPHREMFERIDWSTDQVFDQTMERAKGIEVEVKLLPMCYDVDDPASLRRLCKELLSENSSDTVAAATHKFLGEIVTREGRDRIWPE